MYGYEEKPAPYVMRIMLKRWLKRKSECKKERPSDTHTRIPTTDCHTRFLTLLARFLYAERTLGGLFYTSVALNFRLLEGGKSLD